MISRRSLPQPNQYLSNAATQCIFCGRAIFLLRADGTRVRFQRGTLRNTNRTSCDTVTSVLTADRNRSNFDSWLRSGGLRQYSGGIKVDLGNFEEVDELEAKIRREATVSFSSAKRAESWSMWTSRTCRDWSKTVRTLRIFWCIVLVIFVCLFDSLKIR